MDRETEIAMTAEGSESFKLGDWVVRPSLDASRTCGVNCRTMRDSRVISRAYRSAAIA